MGRFFNMDNKFFVFMGKVADLCLLNLVCILCCIPVVTAGASLAAAITSLSLSAVAPLESLLSAESVLPESMDEVSVLSESVDEVSVLSESDWLDEVSLSSFTA